MPRPSSSLRIGLLVVSTFALFASSASAGAREINQACALAGCFPGDAPGFPVLIVEGGAYRLTGNLVVAAGSDGIAVSSPGFVRSPIEIDLNGFAIDGPFDAVCPSSPPAGQSGIAAYSTYSALTVRNGVIHGMGTNATWGFVYRVEDVVAYSNCAGGVIAAQVRRVQSFQNGGLGIASGEVVDSSIAHANARGISADAVRSSIVDSSISPTGPALYALDAEKLAVGNLVTGNPGLPGLRLYANGASPGLSVENSVVGNGGGGVVGGISAGVLARGNTANGQPDLSNPRAIGVNFTGAGLQLP